MENEKIRKIPAATFLREVAVGEKVDFNGVILEPVECEECYDGCYFQGQCLGVPCEAWNRDDDKQVIYIEIPNKKSKR